MEIPALYLKYTTVMAYKAAAKRMRQVLDISDPLPLSAVLGKPMTGTAPAHSCSEGSDPQAAVTDKDERIETTISEANNRQELNQDLGAD